MTDKKERILNIALELFANDGYSATSTKKIAKGADVSEGLIFRHFKNKKGLLDALMNSLEERLGELWNPIFIETDAKKVIRETIELPFSKEISEEEYHFWRLQFKLKWEKEYNKPEKMQPLIDKLTLAFHELKYEDAENEAKFLLQTLDALAIGILQKGLESQFPLKQILLNKYGF